MPEEYRVTIRLTPALYAQLQARGSQGLPLAAIVRQALVEYLARQPDSMGSRRRWRRWPHGWRPWQPLAAQRQTRAGSHRQPGQPARGQASANSPHGRSGHCGIST